ncbi:MAG TPA: pyridoxal-phosphate dependent enzyme [Firmicutes bacterium]|nr:pyridoxal-phosphate dependent enzyme [Bacillota bacterium]
MFYCLRCGEKYDDSGVHWRCKCGGPLEYEGPVRPFPADLRGRPWSMWRYKEAIPVSPEAIVSLGEGMTPITVLPWEGRRVWLKLDYLCPTGSYKDRGASALISKLHEAGARSIVEDSSGNAGAAIAAYAARCGMQCEIYVPSGNSPAKLAQIRAYGARLVEVAGSRQDVADACRSRVETGGIFYASHNWNPFFIQGIKTIAYELWEQSAVPDWVVLPAGYGSIALGVYRGFRDLEEWGMVMQRPRIALVQAANCAPIYEAFSKGLEEVPACTVLHTVAEGIACSQPVRGAEVLKAVRESKGVVIAVEEEEIIRALKGLAHAGIHVEPTSATVMAGVSKLGALGKLEPAQKVVAILSGIGLKSDFWIS